ncbi:signal peptidase I [Nocardioides dubius]|uniref:Signal peptidase I n=1 Tax=Nocardioides dubius TaxID=317019 RepID=A0ABP4EDV3_9ACTN
MRRRWIAVAALLVSVPVTATATGWRLVEITSDSMSPGLRTGDRVITAPLREGPARGDVVVFTPPEAWRSAYSRWQQGRTAPERMVKRVVAIGGDDVECCAADGRLVVNGEALTEPYLAEEPGRGNTPTYRITVPAGRLWLLGDNRDDSFDSSIVRALTGQGAVTQDAVTGRVLGTD